MTESGQAKTPLLKSQELRVGLVLAVVGGIIAVILTPAGDWLSNKFTGPNVSQGAPVNTDSADPGPTQDTIPSTPVTSPPDELHSVPPAPRTEYLSELAPKGDADNLGEDDSTVQMRNESYDSVVFSLNTFNGGWKKAAYVIPGGYKYFDATIGLDDSTDNDVHAMFRLKIDGSIVGSQPTLGSGDLKKIHVRLPGGAYTIELSAKGVGEAEGVGHVGGAVWGNARFCQTEKCQ